MVSDEKIILRYSNSLPELASLGFFSRPDLDMALLARITVIGNLRLSIMTQSEITKIFLRYSSDANKVFSPDCRSTVETSPRYYDIPKVLIHGCIYIYSVQLYLVTGHMRFTLKTEYSTCLIHACILYSTTSSRSSILYYCIML